SKLVKEALVLEHDGLLTKPFTLEKAFKVLDEQLDLNMIEYEQFTNEYRLNEMIDYYKSMVSWVEKFGAILE
ncbi:MAG: hypothetical protein D6677_03460, partial [Calditrichaeota bacterium]